MGSTIRILWPLGLQAPPAASVPRMPAGHGRQNPALRLSTEPIEVFLVLETQKPLENRRVTRG
jgi:hypothetical protein